MRAHQKAAGAERGATAKSATAVRRLTALVAATDAPVACPDWIYANRHLVENLWARLKEWRAVVTRYEKTTRFFLGVLCLAATVDWLKSARRRTPYRSRS
jgi:transposase